jgi:hypothetical protein
LELKAHYATEIILLFRKYKREFKRLWQTMYIRGLSPEFGSAECEIIGHKGSKLKQSGILTSIQNTYSL